MSRTDSVATDRSSREPRQEAGRSTVVGGVQQSTSHSAVRPRYRCERVKLVRIECDVLHRLRLLSRLRRAECFAFRTQYFRRVLRRSAFIPSTGSDRAWSFVIEEFVPLWSVNTPRHDVAYQACFGSSDLTA